MENPEHDIIAIIHSLTQDAPSQQRATLEKYFTRNAAFTHPFCRTGSFDNSRWLILSIYRWYKIISPRIEIRIDSVAFDKRKLLLYVGIRQTFRLWVVPGYRADVALTTVLQLTEDPYPFVHHQQQIGGAVVSSSSSVESSAAAAGGGASASDRRNGTTKRYWIQSQNDLYQTSEWIRFIVPFGIGWRLVVVWQFFATVMCVIGAILFTPLTVALERVLGGNAQRLRSRKMLGPD